MTDKGLILSQNIIGSGNSAEALPREPNWRSGPAASLPTARTAAFKGDAMSKDQAATATPAEEGGVQSGTTPTCGVCTRTCAT